MTKEEIDRYNRLVEFDKMEYVDLIEEIDDVTFEEYNKDDDVKALFETEVNKYLGRRI